MTSRVLFLRPGFLRENAPNLNGLGRFVPQLQRMTIKFCKERGDSIGIRQFIENDLVRFAEQNPHCALYLKPRRLREPVLITEYLNGERHWFNLRQMSREEVCAWVDLYRTHSGKESQQQHKYDYTDTPTVQGMWNAFTNADPNIAKAKFPIDSKPFGQPATASERVMEMYRAQKEHQAQRQAHQDLPDDERRQLERETQ